LRNYEPTEEEIAAEFEQLKAEKERKKKKKIKKKKEEQIFDLGVDEETGEALRMDDPELLRELIDQEEDPTMKKHLQKLLKKSKKKKIKKEKVEKDAVGEFDDRAFHDSGDFGWSQKEVAKKLYVPSANDKVDAMDTSEMTEASPVVIPGTEDFGPVLPETGIAPRPEAGAIPGGSKLKPVLDDEEVELRLRQKAMEKAIQERLDKRMMRAKKIEVKMAKWISTQRSLKDEAKQLTEDRMKRAEVINEIIAPGVAKRNEEEVANRKDIVNQIRERLRKEITDEVRKEIEDEEDRIQRKFEKAPEAPKVSAAVMDAIQMSDAWESFWRRYKSQLQDWKQWSDEQEEYHKQAAGWYFTQGFIQSQVANNVPAAPDEDPNNIVDPDAEQAGPLLPGQTSVEEEKPREDPDEPPPPPSHKPEDEADDEDDGAKLDEFQRKLRRRKEKKLEKYEALLSDPIFSGKQEPKMMPWGAKDGEVQMEPGTAAPSGINVAPAGATFVPKKAAMNETEKDKFMRMQRMLNTVRGPRLTASSTVGTNFLPTQDDALQFITLERFRRDRHRFKSSDLDSDETEESDNEEEKRQRGSRLPPWMAKANETLDPRTLTSTVMNASATNINQPGEMINPAGEEVQISSSSESEEDEERAERRRAMAAKFNPNSIYGEATITAAPEIKKPAARQRVKEWSMYGTAANAMDSDIRAEEGDTFSFDHIGRKDESKNASENAESIANKKKLFGRKGETPKYLPEESGLQGVGIHKEGPLKGLPKHWQQQTGLRQRPKETYEQQFVEVSEHHLPPAQRELPEFVQDLPDESAVLDAANMAVRDYQQQQLYKQSGKTKMEQYMKRRAQDTRFATEEVKKPEKKKEEENIVLEEENLEFDPSAFFGESHTGGLFSGAKETVAKKNEKPKRSKYAGGFGSSWKKKDDSKKIELNLNSEAAQALAENKDSNKEEEKKTELPSFLKEPVFEKDDSEEFGWGEKNRRKGTKRSKRKDNDGEILGEEKSKKKSKKFGAAWMSRVGEDPDKPLKNSLTMLTSLSCELMTLRIKSRMARAQDKTLAIGKTVIGVPGSRGAEKPRPKRNLKINWCESTRKASCQSSIRNCLIRLGLTTIPISRALARFSLCIHFSAQKCLVVLTQRILLRRDKSPLMTTLLRTGSPKHLLTRLSLDQNHHQMVPFSGAFLKRSRLRRDLSFSNAEFLKTVQVQNHEDGSMDSSDESGTRKRTNPRSALYIRPPTSVRASSCTKTRPLEFSTIRSTMARQKNKNNSRCRKARARLSTKRVNRCAHRSKSEIETFLIMSFYPPPFCSLTRFLIMPHL